MRFDRLGEVPARLGSYHDDEAGGRRFVGWKEPAHENMES